MSDQVGNPEGRFSHVAAHIILGSTIGCDQQNNNIGCGLFSIANATELAFKGDPGTVSGVSTDRRCFLVYIALRYCYGPVKMDWFSYYRSFQRTH